MPIVNITDSQAAILNKVYDRGHDVLYNGVATPTQPAFMPVNSAYKSIIDSPPSGVDPGTAELNTKNGSKTSVAALVSTVTPTIAVYTSAATSTISAALQATIVSASVDFNSKRRQILLQFNGYATATVAAPLSLIPTVNSADAAQAFTFTIPTTGAYIYGSWAMVMPDNETCTIGIRGTTTSLVTVITLDPSNNQIMSIYG